MKTKFRTNFKVSTTTNGAICYDANFFFSLSLKPRDETDQNYRKVQVGKDQEKAQEKYLF